MEVYKSLVRLLKKHLVLAYPVSVKRLKIAKQLDGDCTLDHKKFLIRINKKLSEKESIDTLLHEIAHARSWSHLHDVLDPEAFKTKAHDAAWGVAFAEAYRIYEEHCT